MANKKFVKKVVPFESCDIPAIENWLDDMAKKGLFFTEYGVRRAKFAVSTPRNDTRYRVEYSDVYGNRPTDEKKELYAGSGWEYVDTLFGDLYVFRTDDPDAVELHTEPSSLDGPLKKIVRKHVALAIMYLVMFFTVYIGPAFSSLIYNRQSFWLDVIEFGSLRFFLSILLAVALFAEFIIHLRRARRLKRRIKSGELLPHQERYSGRMVTGRIVLPFSILLCVFWAMQLVAQPGTYTIQGISPGDEFPFPLISEINNEEWEALQDHISYGDYELYQNYKNIRKDILSLETISAWQNISEVISETDSSKNMLTVNAYSVDYYKTISPKLAQRLAEELEARVKNFGAQKIESPEPAAGYLAYYEHSDGRQCLIVQYGSQVELIIYRGRSSLPEHADTFIAYLEGS